MIKYPRLPFKFNICRKLSESDVKKIRALRKKGWPVRKLAKKFKVYHPTIIRWCMSDQDRKQSGKEKYIKHPAKDYLSREEIKQANQRHKDRLKKLNAKKYSDYNKKKSAQRRKEKLSYPQPGD